MSARQQLAELEEQLELGGLTNREEFAIPAQISKLKARAHDEPPLAIAAPIAAETLHAAAPAEPQPPVPLVERDRAGLWIVFAEANSTALIMTGEAKYQAERERDRAFRELWK